MNVCAFVCAHVLVGTSTDQKRVSDSQELELWAIVSHLVWVLGNELESYARAIRVLSS